MWVEEGRGDRGGYHSLEESGQVGGTHSQAHFQTFVCRPLVSSVEAFESQLRSIPVWSLGSAEDAALG